MFKLTLGILDLMIKIQKKVLGLFVVVLKLMIDIMENFF